ncbi:hypothetical protein JST97_13655 [bacterium]|nr:hypothetical protein [bacterium]
MGKVRRVTLYKHGLGFFEVAQPVEGDAEVALSFKMEEMNDVLKSLTVHDPAGTVVSVSYDSHKAVAELLKEIALELPKTGGGAALIARLQGAEVVARTHTRQLRGSVVGLEARSNCAGDKIYQENWLTLWSEQSLVSLNLAEILSIELCDEKLRSDLSYCLDVLLKTSKREAKQLSIFTRGQGERELQLSYLVEAPAWKSSYRILLPTDPQQKPFWEGWALVDNPRDEDWEEVELTLVAGLPVSFRHDLYSPRYVERREIRVQREATVGPVSVGGAVPQPVFAADPFVSVSCDPFGSVDPFACPAADPFGAPCAEPLAARVAHLSATPQAVASERAAQVVAESMGEMFHYRVRHPVTVKRNQSALVPIVGQEAEGGKVVLYNAAERRENPFAAVELTNTTGLTLEGGPLLVIEEHSYAGEAMLDTLKPGDRRIVPYAVDLAVQVESQQNQRHESIHQVKVVNGVMTLLSAEMDSTLYVFENKDDRDKVLWLEHPLRAGWELHDTPAEDERSVSHYRFRHELKARAHLEVRVLLKRIHSQVLHLHTLDANQLEYYRKGGYFSPEAEAGVNRLRGIFEQRVELQNQRLQTEQRCRELNAEIERCRGILPSLSTTAEEAQLRANYVQSMQACEKELKELRATAEILRSDMLRKADEAINCARDLDFEKNL